MNVKEPIREDSTNVIIRKNSDWSEGAVGLLGKWERICTFRKKAHYSASNDYGWKNKFLSIPIIVISTILGSLSFIHPSFIDKAACSRRLSLRNLQPEWPACVCDSYLNGAASSESDLCMKAGTTECYPMNPEDWSCPGDMFACINMDVPTEAPTPEPDGYVPELDNGPDNCCTHSAPWDDQFTLMCQTCAYDVLGEGQTGITYKWYDNDAVQFQLTCSAMGGSDDKVFCSGQNNQNGGHPSYMATCEDTCLLSPTFHPTTTPTISPTKTPTTFAPTSPAERCENYCQNSCAQFGSPEDNVSECQGCDDSKACHPGASNYNSVDAWCTFYACDSVNSRCDNWRCTQPSNAPTTPPTPATRIIYDEEVSGEANNSGNGGVDTLPLASGTNRIQGALKSPSVSDYYRVRAPDGGATITAMRLTMAGDGTNGVKSAYLRFFDATNPGQFVGQTGGGLIASVPANAVSMLEAPSSFSPSASGFAGWAHDQSDFLFMLSYGSASGMMDNAYIIDIDCVISPTPSPTTTKTPTTTPTTSPTPPFEGKSGKSGDSEEESSEDYYGCENGECHIVEENNDCNVDEKMVAICNGEGIWGDFCILNDNIHESCFGETPVPTATNTPTNLPPTPSPVSSQCSPGCPDNWPGDGECDVLCFNSACNYDDGDCPTFAPTNFPTTSSPTRRPTQQPTTYSPTRRPTHQPTPDSVSYMQGGASARSTEENGESNAYLFPYIIGAFNMIIAILSALHTFLKYDALEDRHQQYSRHFGNLQVDLETLLAKPIEQRGSAGTMVERYKIKYSVLINNAPDLPENLERRCCGPEEVHAIEMT